MAAPRGGQAGAGEETVSWRVLVVDWDPKAGEALRARLEGRGMVARVVADAEAALAALEADPADVVLTEACLPSRRSGLWLLAEIRRRWGHGIPVILHTAWFPDSEQLPWYRAADAVLIKPADDDVLAACIAGVLLCKRASDPAARSPEPAPAAPGTAEAP